MRFAPNIEFLFTELDSYEARVEAAAACGANGIEMWGFENKPLKPLRRALDASGIAAAAMVIDPLVGALAPRAQFLSAVDRTLAAACELGCSTVIVISGPPIAEPFEALAAALAEAAERARSAGIGLALEALNTTDHPHTFLSSLSTAIEVVAGVGAASLGVVVDLYHTSVMGEAVADVLVGRERWVRHVQLSSGPDRSEPVGEVANAVAVRHLLDANYKGFLGLEYRPTCASVDSVRRSIDYWKGAQP